MHLALTRASLTMETVTSRGVVPTRQNGSPSPRASTRMRSVPRAKKSGVSHTAGEARARRGGGRAGCKAN
jgi:hypothetical protein